MAGHTISGHVGPGQRKGRNVMIERGRFPGHGGMTGLAFGGETGGFVVGIGARGEFRTVTGKALCRGSRKPRGMTGTAGKSLMYSGQRKRRRVIIGRSGPGPEGGVMASLAAVLKNCLGVVGVRHAT